MYIQSTTPINYTLQTNNIKNITQVENTTFSIENEQNKPNKITYNEYKSMKRYEVELMYPSSENKELNIKAYQLYDTVHGTDDEILNKIMFEKQINASNTKADEILHEGFSSKINGLKLGKQLKIEIFDKLATYMENNNINAIQDEKKFLEALNKFSNGSNGKIDYLQAVENQTITAQEYFESLELTKKQIINYQDPNAIHFSETYKSSNLYIYGDELLENINELKKEYESKVSENEILKQYLQKDYNNVV